MAGSTLQSDDIPQADRLGLLPKIVVAAVYGPITATAIGNVIFDSVGKKYTPRQISYYAGACVSLDLLSRTESGFRITRQGHLLATAATPKERDEQLRQSILRTPMFKKLREHLGADTSNRTLITEWLTQNTNLSEVTASRRASTIVKYLDFATGEQPA